MSRFAVILPAAGRSTRFSQHKRKKPFVDLKGRAIWVRSAELFVNRDDVAQTLVVVAEDDREWFLEKYRPNLAFMDIEIVPGGAERVDSVRNALARVNSDVDFVAVHDAARPLLTQEWIDAIFRAAEKSGAAIPAVPVTSTLKRVGAGPPRAVRPETDPIGEYLSGTESVPDRPAHAGNVIEETVPRENLVLAQTPQVFRREWLLEAFARQGDVAATDEAQLVEGMGHAVTVIEGWPMNIKITTHADFKMAAALIDALPKPKTLGALHPFADEEPRRL